MAGTGEKGVFGKATENLLSFLRNQASAENSKTTRAHMKTGLHPAIDTLHAYVHDELSDTELRNIMKHISRCSQCAKEVMRIRRIETRLDNEYLQWANKISRSEKLKKILSLVEFSKRKDRYKQTLSFYTKSPYKQILQGALAAMFIVVVGISSFFLSQEKETGQQTAMQGPHARGPNQNYRTRDIPFSDIVMQEPHVRGSNQKECDKMLSLFDRGTGSKDSLQKEQLLKNALTLPCEDKEIKSKVYNNLADCYEAQGKIKEAIVEYHKAIETDPALATSYLSLGDIYRKTGEISEAIKYYEKALLCLTPAGSKEKQKQADIEELKKVLDELKALKADK